LRQSSGKGPAEYFTGMVGVDPLFAAAAPGARCRRQITEPGIVHRFHFRPTVACLPDIPAYVAALPRDMIDR
jgi:hypothetical protein